MQKSVKICNRFAKKRILEMLFTFPERLLLNRVLHKRLVYSQIGKNHLQPRVDAWACKSAFQKELATLKNVLLQSFTWRWILCKEIRLEYDNLECMYRICKIRQFHTKDSKIQIYTILLFKYMQIVCCFEKRKWKKSQIKRDLLKRTSH